MKRNRLLALVLAVCLCAALAVPAAAATPYTDVAGHWALPYIQDMTKAGMFTGYDDGTFRPNNTVTRSEALALCARITQNSDSRYQLAADQTELLNELFPGMAEDWWFRKEAAACMALGIVDADTLAHWYAADVLNQPMSKADFAMYLVRGVGLEELARTLNVGELPFDDQWIIDEEYRSYVKVLSTYGVVEGDENGNFNPEQLMPRAVCATMLSRAIEHIVEERGVSVELPQYTKYAWTSGTVVDVAPAADGGRTMTIYSEINGAETVFLPAATKVYQYNKLDQFTALKTNCFVKVCYAADGKTVESVRVTPGNLVETVAGDCGGLTTDTVIIGGMPFTIDRFTQVAAGGKKGDRSIIDYAANYTDAEAGVNLQGNVLWLKLSGGTRLVEGILTDVTVETAGLTERTTITVKGYNGVSTTYSVPESAVITVNGGQTVLRESQKGHQVALRVSDTDLSAIKAVDINLTDRYVQGVLRTVNTKSTPVRIDVRVDGDVRDTTYDVSDDCSVTNRGAKSALSDLTLGSFVTAKVEGGTITVLYAWQGYEDTVGTLTAINFGGEATTLEVTRADGTVVRFAIPVERLGSVAFTAGGKDGNIANIRTGDYVVVTSLYNDVTQVDYSHQAANVKGTLEAINRKTDVTELTVRFADGTTHTYTAAANITVTQSGKAVNISAVNPGSTVSMVAEGDRVISIEITGTAASTTELIGTVYTVDAQARTAYVRVEENGTSRLVHVRIPTTAKIITTEGDTLTNITRLNEGDTIQAFGSYGTDGVFEARSVIRR